MLRSEGEIGSILIYFFYQPCNHEQAGDPASPKITVIETSYRTVTNIKIEK